MNEIALYIGIMLFLTVGPVLVVFGIPKAIMRLSNRQKRVKDES